MNAQLPTGTVTFLFTDIEGSTRLLHQLAERYAEALAEHRRVLREAFARHGGAEVDTQGDAFFVAFARASDAVAAAVEAQAGLGEGPMRVRMGLHTGEPAVTEEGYVGLDVHRAARIAAAGHGGQVLLSQATRDLIEADVRDLGEHRLKDLSAAERIFQLGERDFPALKTLYATNLPIPLTPFLGRGRELADVQALLERDDVRLLTLTGAGGSGKTRLALQAAAAAADEYPHGVWWVPLAAVTDPAVVSFAAARAVGGSGELTEVVGDRRLLLVLDNFEHVIDAAGDVATLLSECPRADVLVTSRERLRVSGEHVFSVPVLARADARELFVTRARAALAEFEPDEHVDELCARLDDLPLALELAAARVALLTTRQLLERLGKRLDLLRGGRDAEVRQRTLRATIEWSYELLDADEQRLLAALSVFRGGWTLDAAESVCGADVELLQSLVDKSLTRRWESGRFGMLETVREFAAEQLTQEARDTLLRRLLEHLLEVFVDANLTSEAAGPQRMELAEAERPNIDVALAWAEEAREFDAALRLIWFLEMYWNTNDPVGGQERLDGLLAAAPADVDAALRARGLRIRGGNFDMIGRNDLAEGDYELARDAFRALGDEEGAAHLTNRIAASALQRGDFERAARLGAEALELDRRTGNRRDEAVALHVLGMTALAQGRRGEGIELMQECADVAASAGFVWWRGVALLSLGDALVRLGDVAGAADALRDALGPVVETRDRVNLPFAVALAGVIAAQRDDPTSAGMLWGAVEAAAERNPRAATALAEYAPLTEAAHGAAIERGRERGRTLSLEEAATLAASLHST